MEPRGLSKLARGNLGSGIPTAPHRRNHLRDQCSQPGQIHFLFSKVPITMAPPTRVDIRRNVSKTPDMLDWCWEEFGGPGPGRWQVNSEDLEFIFWKPKQATFFILRWL